MTTTDHNTVSSNKNSTPDPLYVSAWGKLVYFVMFLAVAALAGTGVFWSYLIDQRPMHGWILMAHAAIAPAFAIGLALVALTWADRNRFGCKRTQMRASARFLFWLVLLLGLVVILSGVVPMTPTFGTDGQHALYLTHRYSAVALSAAMLLHLLSLIRVR